MSNGLETPPNCGARQVGRRRLSIESMDEESLRQGVPFAAATDRNGRSKSVFEMSRLNRAAGEWSSG
jgi:hypothetical protein